MNKIGVWDLKKPLQHPSGHSDVDQKDVCVDLLSRKLCPVHLAPLVLHKEIKLGDDYARKSYGCMSCRCTVDYVGDELKSDSVGRTLDIIDLMIKEAKELAAAKINPTDEGGIEI